MNRSASVTVALVVALVAAAGCLGGLSGAPERPATDDRTATPSSLAVQTPTNGTGPSPLVVEVPVGEAVGVDAATVTVYDETTERGLPTSRDGSTMTATLRGQPGTTHDLRVTAQTTDGTVVERRVSLRITEAAAPTETPATAATATPSGGSVTTQTAGATTARLTTAPPPTATSAANAAPVADLAVAPTTASVGETVALDATRSSDPDGSVALYEWDFDGDGTVDRQTTSSTVSHGYGASGTYDASVTVVDDGGATAVARQSVTVRGDTRPTADAGDGGTYGVGEAVSFDGSASADPDGTIARYEWDFDGDGTIDRRSSGPRATHAYGATGTYDARLAVTDDDGNTDTDRIRIVVENAAPTAEAGPDRTVRTGEAAAFDGSGSTDSDGTIARYEWDLDGDGTYDTAGGSPGATRSYASAGTYEVRLRVTDDDGTTATDTATVTVVSNRAPTADAGDDAAVTVGEGHTFDASGSTDSDGTIVEYRWDLDGDGAIDRRTSNPALTHAYGSTGTYDARVTVVDDDGATDRDTATVTVTN